MNIVWTKPNCPFCDMAKKLLDSKGIDYEVRVIGDPWTRDQLLEACPGVRTVPQVILDDVYIGTYERLKEHLST
jgi:glutaredoxin|tara:strand:+ start:587 stop:808 length:222 start_codon:yes stop_codon:yes gene_type:complete